MRFGRLSDDDQYESLPNGERYYPLQNRLVWIVRFSRAVIPLRGRPGTVTTDLNVVIDALSGKFLGAFMVA